MSERGCIWRGSERPRTLAGRHADDCDGEHCRGCLPCPDPHCVVCGIEHVDEMTCPGCVGQAREDLTEVRDLFATLPGQAAFGGNDGRLEASRPILGGEAMVMLAPSSDGRAATRGKHAGRDASHLADEHPDEAPMPEITLMGWEDDWRSLLGSPTSDLVTVDASAAYLLDHLSWAAQHHPAFDAFAAEMRQQRARIEDVLHTGQRPWLGAPCETCGQPLERIWATDEAHDRWWCERCKNSFELGEYVENVSRAARKHKGWLTSRDMTAEHQIPRGSLSSWASDGKVRKRKDANLGRMVYHVADALVMRDRLEVGDAV